MLVWVYRQLHDEEVPKKSLFGALDRKLVGQTNECISLAEASESSGKGRSVLIYFEGAFDTIMELVQIGVSWISGLTMTCGKCIGMLLTKLFCSFGKAPHYTACKCTADDAPSSFFMVLN